MKTADGIVSTGQMLPAEVPEYRVHTKLSRVEHWRHVLEIVALIAAAIWAFYVFIYQERIKPAGEPPRLQVSTRVVHDVIEGGKELVTIKVTLKNTGATEISMGALLVNAYGVRYANDGKRESGEFHPARGITIINRGLSSAAPVLLYSHLSQWQPLGVARQTLRLPAAQELTFEQPFVIERRAYETLRITYGYCYQRLDNRNATALVPRRTRDGAFDVRDILRANGVYAGLRCGGTLSYNGEYAL